MKLSAPPPSQTPEPPATGQQPDATNPIETPPDSPPPDAPPPAPAPMVLLWPAWYSGMDAALAGLVLVLAFATASFVARDSDVWLHLAAGKRLFAGQYTPGSDPFSYSAADRPWVNHSWLADAGAYLLYGGQGKLLVIIKALVIALTFGLLISLRRPRHPLWPWTVVACVAAIAAAPQFTLRPIVVSMLFLAITLVLLFRLPHKPDSWRFPIAIGITFCLWSNCDEWFFLGPLTLVLLILGDLIQKKLLRSPEPTAAEIDEDTLGPLPDTLTLAKALGIGVLACMVNPHHVRVWELPFELVGAPGIEIDSRLQKLRIGPNDGAYWNDAALGANANGAAYAILFVFGAAALGFSPGRVRVAHIALWIGFAALSLLSVYAIPFFAIVAVPLVAAQLNALSARAELKTWDNPKSRMLLLGSTVGRILCVFWVCVLCVLAYPGWLQPDPGNALPGDPGNQAYARRVAWGVDPEPSLVNAAEQFKKWRETGQLPADARGVIANTDLANYVAWFAPREKVFIDARFNHHRRELSDYVAVRRGLALLAVKDDRPNPDLAIDVLKKVGAEYVVIQAGPPGDSQAMRNRSGEVVAVLYQIPAEWSPWFLNGRTTVFGWHSVGERAKPTFAALRIDPVALAFGTGVVPLGEPALNPPPPPLGWEEAFIRPAQPVPVSSAEAIAWVRIKTPALPRLVRREALRSFMEKLFFAVPGPTDFTAHQFAMGYTWRMGVIPFAPNETTDPTMAADFAMIQAAPIIALRDVRRAILENPDHPDPYYALGEILRDLSLPMSESERRLGQIIAYRQCLDRLPKPDRYKRGQYVADPVTVSLDLALLYLGAEPRMDPLTRKELPPAFHGVPLDFVGLNGLIGQSVFREPNGNLTRSPYGLAPQGLPPGTQFISGNTPYFLPLDVARETLKLAEAYAPAVLSGDATDFDKRRVQEVQKYLKYVDTALIRANERYEPNKARGVPLRRLIDIAGENGLAGEQLRLLNERAGDLQKEYQQDLPRAAMSQVMLELALGHVENANELLKLLATPEALTKLEGTKYIDQLRYLKYHKAFLAGQYKTAGELWESIAGGGIGSLDKLPPAGPMVDRRLVLFTLASMHRKPTLLEAETVLAALLDPPLVPMAPLTQPLTWQLWLGEWAGATQMLRLQVNDSLAAESNFYYRRGLISLLEGDIPAAKQRFMQSTRRAPPGWNLSDVGNQDAQRYLRLIAAAESRRAP